MDGLHSSPSLFLNRPLFIMPPRAPRFLGHVSSSTASPPTTASSPRPRPPVDRVPPSTASPPRPRLPLQRRLLYNCVSSSLTAPLPRPLLLLEHCSSSPTMPPRPRHHERPSKTLPPRPTATPRGCLLDRTSETILLSSLPRQIPSTTPLECTSPSLFSSHSSFAMPTAPSRPLRLLGRVFSLTAAPLRAHL